MRDLHILKKISEEGLRIFTFEDLRKLTAHEKNEASLLRFLKNLIKEGFVRKLYKGHYALTDSVLAGAPLHKFEIIKYISSPSAVCCWSALSFHGLSDQVIQNVYMLVPYGKTIKNTSKYIYEVDQLKYVVIRVKPEYYFGTERQFLNETSVSITDIERSLLDGLIRPQYCGGFLEVMDAFRRAYDQDKINTKKIITYADRLGILVSKRLGWVFETLQIFPEEVKYLKGIPCKGRYKLDVSKPDKGEWIPQWHLRRNF